jgi:hypothetical protein
MMDPERERMLAEALAEYLDRQSREETVDLDGFCRGYPDLSDELRRDIQTLIELGNMAEAPSEDLPERLSGHKILSQIGAGGMGRVFVAIDEALGRKVAIKMLSPRFAGNPALRTRFMHEARAMARLSHPNIVRIYNLGPVEEPPHFVMEYLEGVPLTDAARALTIRQKVELMRKVILAAQFLHENQVIHRDLKPGNILVGPDLEPKLLDFGLALRVDDGGQRLTLAGEVMGTPSYFSPEQARAEGPLDARSDIFSLGAILYELLTGTVPFHAGTLAEQIQSICEKDPVLPRRINPHVAGDLQNICLKALDKDPSDRYGSAREMAADLERFLAGEAVLAAPRSYSRLMAGKIEQHLRELEGWRHDHILSEYEYDSFRKCYDRLVEREDAWIMEVRRLSLPQVSLYLGAWILVVGAALIVLFRYAGLAGTAAVAVSGAAAAATAGIGVRCWKLGEFRISIGYLLAFCLLLPIVLLVAMSEYGLFMAFTRGQEDLELFSKLSGFKRSTNAQMWWAILLSLPAYYWLRRFTRASVFSLVFAVMAALFCLVTLLRTGMLEWLEKDPGKVYFYLIPFAMLFLVAGLALERLRYASDSRYFYPIAVVFTLVALSGVASFHEPYAEWLKATAPWTRGQIEYLFIINAGIYLVLQVLAERFSSAQMRTVAKAFRFVLPGHVMTSLLLLGLSASERWHKSPAVAGLRLEARVFEVLLPVVACLFVFGSIPKQMKNFFATGLLFLAIGIVRLQQDLFQDRAVWPVALLAGGLVLMLAAANYSPLKMAVIRPLGRWMRRS